MRVAVIAVVSSALVLCGCAGSRGFGPGASTGASTGGSATGFGGGSSSSDSSPSLGLPSFPSQDSSSSYKPNGAKGPVLGFPELPAAFQDNSARRAPRTAQLQAPEPKARKERKISDPAASPVSTFDKSVGTPTWNRFYRSTDRRPIESLTLGTGPTRVAIVASMHGDEIQSTGLVEELAYYLARHPQHLKDTTVLLVKCPNPDGFAGRSPYNIHGVDLNRNFPAENWKLLELNRAGAKAKSEAETQVAVRLLTDFRPSLLVHLKDSRRGPVVNYEGSIQSRAEQIAGMISGQVVQGLGEKTSGSVENFALTRLSCPSLTILLSREKTDQAAWARNQDALLSLCGQTPSGRMRSKAADDDRPNSEDRGNSIDNQPDPFEQPPVHNSSLQRNQRAADRNGGKATTRSKNVSRSKLPEFPAPVPDVGYLELPPP